MRVAVAGGTGLMGRLVVTGLSAAGHEPVVVARSTGADLRTGDGLALALAGCGAVVDVTNVDTTRAGTSVAFFNATTGHLLDAGKRAGVSHVVALSIVGSDRVDFGYYLGKRRQEELLAAGPVPWSVLRTTQFHQFPEQLLARGRGPLVVTPRILIQPIAAGEVASALVGIATGAPAGLVTPMAGPEQLQLVDMMRRVVRTRGQRRVTLPVRLPGQVGKAMATGGLLPSGPYSVGHQTFSEYLGSAVTASRS